MPPASKLTCASGPSYGCLCVAVQQPRPYRRRLLPAAGLKTDMCLRPVLWLPVRRSTATTVCHAAGLSTNAVQSFLRLRRALFRFSFAFLFVALQTFPFLHHSSLSLCNIFRSYVVPLHRSSDFSVPMSFRFIALQTFPFLCHSSLSFFFQVIIFQTVGFSEA